MQPSTPPPLGKATSREYGGQQQTQVQARDCQYMSEPGARVAVSQRGIQVAALAEQQGAHERRPKQIIDSDAQAEANTVPHAAPRPPPCLGAAPQLPVALQAGSQVVAGCPQWLP